MKPTCTIGNVALCHYLQINLLSLIGNKCGDTIQYQRIACGRCRPTGQLTAGRGRTSGRGPAAWHRRAAQGTRCISPTAAARDSQPFVRRDSGAQGPRRYGGCRNLHAGQRVSARERGSAGGAMRGSRKRDGHIPPDTAPELSSRRRQRGS